VRCQAAQDLARPAALVVSKKAIPSTLRTAMQASPNRDDPQGRLEATARADFEQRAGRKVTDAEWSAVRERLLEFMRILRAWDRTPVQPQRSKVDSICQPEP
jgi:hypothetical protein